MATHKVYVLRRCDGLVKIGTTTNLPARMRAIATAHGPLEVVRLFNGGPKLERKLHHLYRRYRQFGEWFTPDPAMMASINSMPDGGVATVSASEQQIEWERGEVAKAAEASCKVKQLVKYRRARRGLSGSQALVDLSADYGLPVHFLTHLHRRSPVTITAHGFAAVREAYLQEMREYLAELEATMSAMRAEDDLAEVATKRAPLHSGREVR